MEPKQQPPTTALTTEEQLQHIISSEIAAQSTLQDQKATALGATALVSMMAGALNLDDDDDEDDTHHDDNKTCKDDNNKAVDSSKKSIGDFHALMKSSNTLTQLLDDYGEYTPLEPEEVFQQRVAKEQQQRQQQQPASSSSNRSNTNNKNSRSRGALVPNGKAPIHVDFTSFGYKYGCPSSAGWSHVQPLAPLDCRALPRASHRVSKLSGLSHHVKRELLNDLVEDDEEEGVENNNNEKKKGGGRRRTKSELSKVADDLAKDALQALHEAIRDGGYGHGLPLKSTIYVGSEYGRHRSVVLCETAAQRLRDLLRQNEGDRITQPVSVGTRHRDVDHNHQDEEAFGYDLIRQAQVEKKKREREEWLESRW
uniref:Uncharacterized protein n=1 Tax=Leptocylindrus danicus TaxID=163516 RepID=A0A7S2LR62_9STRA